MINSADPFFSSRSSMRASIDVIATYVIDMGITRQAFKIANSRGGPGDDWCLYPARRHYAFATIIVVLDGIAAYRRQQRGNKEVSKPVKQTKRRQHPRHLFRFAPVDEPHRGAPSRGRSTVADSCCERATATTG